MKSRATDQSGCFALSRGGQRKCLPPLCSYLQLYSWIPYLLVLPEGCSRALFQEDQKPISKSVLAFGIYPFLFLDIKLNTHNVSSPHVFVILHCIFVQCTFREYSIKIYILLLTKMKQHFPFISHFYQCTPPLGSIINVIMLILYYFSPPYFHVFLFYSLIICSREL